MLKILILDDDHKRHRKFSKNFGTEDLKHVFTSHDAIRCLECHDYDYVFLDHDLNGKIMEESGPDTGYEVAEWIANNPDRQPNKLVIVHSLNNIGASNMQSVLKDSGINSMYVPYLWTMENVLEKV